MKIKFSILTVVMIVCVLCVLLVSLFFISYKMNNAKPANVDSEIEALLDTNKNAINEIGSAKVLPVRSINKDDHILGDENAKIKIVVYSDFECPACLQYIDSIEKVKQEYKNDIVIAYRHYPLRIHEYAIPAAIASECASEQGKFWEMHDKIFADNKAQRMNNEQFKKDAIDLGLDQVKFNQCLDTEKYGNKITEQIGQAKLVGITGTPTTFINGRILPGAYPFEDFTDSQGLKREGLKTIITSELAK